jgi:inosine-uridine nucleoside N-ribohydrolase
MARKVIIDCAPGIDDAIALLLGVCSPRFEVVAVTATEGHVSAQTASRNVQAVLDLLDPARLPRVGTAQSPDHAPLAELRHMHGDDGLAGSGLAVAQLHQQHPSDKIICDQVRAAPEQVTIICLGPLTNVARAFQRDPGIIHLVDRVIMSGGSVSGIGNITPAAEYNMHYDPESARQVFRSPTTKTLVPLDCTRQVAFTMDLVEQLPPESNRIGAFLRKLFTFYFRAYHQSFGEESILLHKTIALLWAMHPTLFETQEMAGDVETRGELTIGATVFDRRPTTTWRANMEVAMGVDPNAIRDVVMRGLLDASRGRV